MTLSLFIIFILCIYTTFGILDQISIQIGLYSPLFAATFTGLVMGDIYTGLAIGATLQLMVLGVATYGGATVPDFLSGAIIGTAYTILSKENAAYGIGVAVPIGLLLTQLDILARMTNTFFQQKANAYAEEGNYKGVERCNMLGALPWILSRVIPVFVGLYFGEHVVDLINNYIPTWIMDGLKVAGAILPAMGIAILMRYLPIKKYWPYFLIGFVLLAYGAAFFSVLGSALVGVALAGIYVMNHRQNAMSSATNNQDDDDEVEIDG